MHEVSDELYDCIQRHDRTFDGRYYIGIRTTGIVCFPSCRSRVPKKENIRVYSSLAEAICAGFRCCKRCQPDNPHRLPPDAEVARRVFELLQIRYQDTTTLKTLADELSISPYHLQRIYKRVTGFSPSRHLQLIRMEQAKRMLLRSDQAVADIAMEVGFRSSSHFSTAFRREMGVGPAEYRRTLTQEPPMGLNRPSAGSTEGKFESQSSVQQVPVND